MRRHSPLLLFSLRVLAQDPGLPNGVADHQSAQLPAEADVVIIGSGISGTSIAWHLLKGTTSSSKTPPLRIAMLEARQACSGATGRNGGHIRPSSYAEYAEYAGAKQIVAREEAARITRLRSAHVEALISAADSLPEQGRLAAEARVVDSIDAFFDDARWETAVRQMEVLKKEMPDIGSEWSVFEKDEARNISLMPEVTGIMTGTAKMAAAIWPYRFVTHSLKSLLDTHPSFSLDTNTAALEVIAITSTSDAASPPSPNYEVLTARGTIQAKHVVHASNAWTPHLVPGLRGAIRGARLHMSAHLGGGGLPRAGAWPSYSSGDGSLPGGRAWSLYRNGLDYAVQMPRDGEYMFGGDMVGVGGGVGEGRNTKGAATATAPVMSDAGPPSHITASYLNGALPSYFGYENWGAERTDFPRQDGGGAAGAAGVYPGRSKRVWVGIEGSARDGRPFVGRLPRSATARPVGDVWAGGGGEWVSAAFDGEGMCFAWLCGRALSGMMMAASGAPEGREQEALGVPEWFPRSFLVTEERLANHSVTPGRAHRWMYPRMANALSWDGEEPFLSFIKTAVLWACL
ncbi:hypothetical protein KVR01_012968 [Diaporthe batatas]|uniref:uncharacterized protein n=1 Tax=Diaporthe batatas TaxID=748121 RepID=UPI001D04FC34|nr:uncharacterized protein KVR01_012968 [Diaporthe batatas]KAG8157260.1 hypothetical protein KVR01_012968 [Diaporthe batatas]